MRMTLFVFFTLLAITAAAFALIWTFDWMPEAFRATDPAIHDQVRWGYVHGGVIALLSGVSAVAAYTLRPFKKEV